MPLILVQHKAGRGLKEVAEKLAQKLPKIAAPALSCGNEDLNGLVAPVDIEVWCTEGSPADQNTKDLEIIVWAHLFDARLADLEGRKETILEGVRTFLSDYDQNISGFVWILLQPTAFGRI